jgi:integrase
MARKQKLWSYQAGERGVNRVNLFDRGTRGMYLEYRDTGTRKRVALGRITRDEGKKKADELALRFRNLDARKNAPLTLGELFDKYEANVTPTKSRDSQAHDKRRRGMFLAFFGSGRMPGSFSILDWNRFILARRSGQIKSRKKNKRVGEAVIRTDLAHLSAVLNFATMAGDGNGGFLLDRNPLKGLPLPTNDSPARPVMTDEQFASFREASKHVKNGELFTILAHETGHRRGSIRQLRWNDIDFQTRRIHWVGTQEKTGNDHTTPLSASAIAVLEKARRASMAIGEAFVFPTKDGKPLSRMQAGSLFTEIAKLSGEIPTGQRYGWHSLRRKLASDLDATGASLKTIIDLGGWRKAETAMIYIKSDEKQQRQALENRKVASI